MKRTSTKFLIIYLSVILVAVAVGLLIYFGIPAYSFLDSDTLKSYDGTLYDKFLKGYTDFLGYGEFFGRVKGERGPADEGYKEGIYSADSSGSDDYVVFVDGYYTVMPKSFRVSDLIFVKQGCQLNLCDMNRVTDVRLELGDPETANIKGEIYFLTEYFPESGSIASDVLNSLIGEELTDIYDGDILRAEGYVCYKIEGIDLFDIRCPAQYWEQAGWIVELPDRKQYRINTEGFKMFDMPERMEEFLQSPAKEYK